MQYVEDMIIEHDLVDIWRIRNPTDTRFTWRQKSPLIQRRLDYWLIINDLQEDVESVRRNNNRITQPSHFQLTALMKTSGDPAFGNSILL